MTASHEGGGVGSGGKKAGGGGGEGDGIMSKGIDPSLVGGAVQRPSAESQDASSEVTRVRRTQTKDRRKIRLHILNYSSVLVCVFKMEKYYLAR